MIGPTFICGLAQSIGDRLTKGTICGYTVTGRLFIQVRPVDRLTDLMHPADGVVYLVDISLATFPDKGEGVSQKRLIANLSKRLCEPGRDVSDAERGVACRLIGHRLMCAPIVGLLPKRLGVIGQDARANEI